ncbi:MAG: hypothetical protein WB677_05350 [Xanthobacteraceae bacterium]|jgi:hypothetical protein
MQKIESPLIPTYSRGEPLLALINSNVPWPEVKAAQIVPIETELVAVFGKESLELVVGTALRIVSSAVFKGLVRE